MICPMCTGPGFFFVEGEAGDFKAERCFVCDGTGEVDDNKGRALERFMREQGIIGKEIKRSDN